MSYQSAWQAMQDFVTHRQKDDLSEIWLVEHPAVFTQGQAGKAEHILNPGDIPIVQSDRGGQVTYHGPGQAVVYILINLKEADIGIRTLVQTIEEAVIRLLANHEITGERREGAPGIYVNEAKIASIGLRVKKFNTYHGVSINTDMDLEPFSRINPCGYEGLAVTDLNKEGSHASVASVQTEFASELAELLGYTIIS
ncbi:octanoyltransferase [Solemya velum gill symbiont]|nr:octanoyltransferase [Solemya velum gill symbiont]OOY37013.1 octanoyltransferase [Solemya velum gill symbiont]OOY39845.1 octanoyltransferase [Solemya velum gill symbiont]OOY44677.1 octanoyltransferase [Solemya velum gill symbiont]OOY46364.1 octanoyltransferase [Solemya velum gill symbiont]